MTYIFKLVEKMEQRALTNFMFGKTQKLNRKLKPNLFLCVSASVCLCVNIFVCVCVCIWCIFVCVCLVCICVCISGMCLGTKTVKCYFSSQKKNAFSTQHAINVTVNQSVKQS